MENSDFSAYYLSCQILFTLCPCLVSVCIGQRLGKNTTYVNFLITGILCFTVVWNIMANIMLYVNHVVAQSCQIFAWLCPVCYLSTKNITYLYFVERVYIIKGGMSTRRQFKLYWFHGLLISLSLTLLVIVIVYDTHMMDFSQGCQIKFNFHTIVALLAYDVTLNLYLTILFVIPLFTTTRWSPSRSKFHNLAKRTLCASVVALVFTSANLAVCLAWPLISYKECLLLCCVDLNVNALVVDYSSRVKEDDSAGTELTTSGVASIIKHVS
ncbi:hypothetical protein K7432_008579 [Basidiobolus ranarum]|uniref:G-protein coupled receptors family 1 profile domain-containing protein n=1 Tax=Basidiobolus ranarum TaxID=34480 RepID=A0ABR2WRU3_9FUNG